MDNYAAESMVYLTCSLADKGVKDYAIESAICKVYASESVWRIVNEAVQIAAGSAYMRAYPYEQLLRDARINIIFEGTNEILRCFIALAGFQGPGLHLKEVGKALRFPIKGIGLLSEVAFKRIKRDIVGLGDRITKADPYFKREAATIEDFVKELSRSVEKALMKHGSKIWEKEFIQKRIADIMIDLYGIISTVSRTSFMIQKKGLEKALLEIELTQAFCDRATRRIKRNFRAMDNNDDERIINIAKKTYEMGGYPFDIF